MTDEPTTDDEGRQPATLPEPEQATEQTYTVTGPHRVLDHEPGETFKATIPPEQRQFLLDSGHLSTGEKELREPLPSRKPGTPRGADTPEEKE